MTDQEITEIIATKVMGFDWSDMPIDDYEPVERRWCEELQTHFTPLLDDCVCMRAWDKHVENIMQNGTFTERDELMSEVAMIFTQQGATRRRAMCSCMAKAASQ